MPNDDEEDGSSTSPGDGLPDYTFSGGVLHVKALDGEKGDSVLRGLEAVRAVLSARERVQERVLERLAEPEALARIDRLLARRFSATEVARWERLRERIERTFDRNAMLSADALIDILRVAPEDEEPPVPDLGHGEAAEVMRELAHSLGVPVGRVRRAITPQLCRDLQRLGQDETVSSRRLVPYLLRQLGVPDQTYYDGLRDIREQDLTDPYPTE